MSRLNRSFERKPSHRRTRADRDARAAARPKISADNGEDRPSLPLGKCDLDRIPHRPDVLCENWLEVKP